MVSRPPPEPKEPGKAAQAAVMLAHGSSCRSAAAAVGVSERTVHRWRSNPKFRARIEELRTAMTDQTVGALTSASRAAVAELTSLLKAESEAVRLGAARAILDKFPALSEFADLTKRIEALESESRHQEHNPWSQP